MIVGALTLPAAGPTAAGNLGGQAALELARNAQRYTDPRGDADAGGLDIATVDLANDDAGRLNFTVRIPSHPTLPSRKGVGIFFDADRNPNTGSGGTEYRVFVEPSGETGLHKWDPGQRSWSRFGEPVLSPYYDRGIWAGGIRLKSVGSPSVFNFVVLTFDRLPGGGSDINDVAPNSGGWTYRVKTGSGGQPPKKRKLFVAGVERRPNPPVAGQNFTIDAAVWRLPVGSGRFRGRVDCGARIGGKAVRRLDASVEPDRAVCTWDLPFTAGGKTITVLMVVTEGEATAVKQFTALVAQPRPTLSIAEIKTVPPRGPQAGSVFYYGMKVHITGASGSTKRITEGKVSCRATIGRIVLQVIRAEVVPEDAAVQCGWNDLPATASGRTLTGTLVVRSESPERLTFRHGFKFVVR